MTCIISVRNGEFNCLFLIPHDKFVPWLNLIKDVLDYLVSNVQGKLVESYVVVSRIRHEITIRVPLIIRL